MKLPQLQDLSPAYDPMGGSPKTPPRGIPVSSYQQQHKPNGHHIKLPPFTNILQMFQIGAIMFFAVAWWTKRESSSDVTLATQNLAITAITKRLDSIDKRFEAVDARADKALDTSNKNADDLHELMIKFRIMVELVDGAKKSPELHK